MKGKIKFLVSESTVCIVKKGENIAQMLLLPGGIPGKYECTREGDFESTNFEASANAFIAFIANHREKDSILTLETQGSKFEGMFDSGNEVPVIYLREWPRNWDYKKFRAV